jgi:hypothetical protein
MLCVEFPMITFDNLFNPTNAFAGIYPDTVIDVSNTLNAAEAINSIDDDRNRISFKDVQSANASWPILVVFSLIVNCVKLVKLLNAFSGIYPDTVIVLDMPENEDVPIDFIDDDRK